MRSIEQSGGYKPRPFQEMFDAGSQGGSTPGVVPSPLIPINAAEGKRERISKKSRREKRGSASQKSEEATNRQQHLMEDHSGGFVCPVEVPQRFLTAEQRRLSQRERERASRSSRRKHSP